MKTIIRLFLFMAVVASVSLLVEHVKPVLGQPDLMHLPYRFVDEVVVSGLDVPTGFAFSPDGRIFITQKDGVVRVVDHGVLQPGNFIDLSGEVNTTSDRGLMGVTVHPNFPATPYVYLSYVYEPPEAHGYNDKGARVSRLLRVQADPNNLNVALPGSGVVLLGTNSTFANIGNPEVGDKKPFTCVSPDGGFVRDCLPLEGTSHALNFMRFGRDGALYASNGDGVNFTIENIRAQSPDSLAGKILRINPLDGNGYPDNPFCDGDLGDNRCKVFALGLRNPFRFAFHPTTGELYVGEVGNNTWEEISVGHAGTNFGWPCYEGLDVVTSSNATCDEVFNGTRPATTALFQYPHANGRGAAIAGDFYTGSTYPATYRNLFFFADYNVGQINYLSTAPDGTAKLNDFASNVLGPVQISAGPDGDLYVLKIQAGELSHIRYGGSAADAQAQTQASANAVATQGNKPKATIITPTEATRYRIGDKVMFSGKGSDASGNALPAANLQWDAVLHHHDHVHYDYFHGKGFTGNFAYQDHGDDTYIELCLTVTDASKQKDKQCVNVRAQEVTYTFNSTPAGLPLIYDGTRYTTPFKVISYVNAKRQVDAPLNPQAGVSFGAWSDQGAATHEITLQATEQTLTANYIDDNGQPLADASGNAQEAKVVNATTITSTTTATTASATSSVAPSAGAGTGTILREWWTGIGGKTINDLTKNPKYPDHPTGSELITSFEGPASFANDYGTRIRGYLYPPVSGAYQFWIASDDSGQLWLSTDDNPANKQLIASVPQWTLVRQWDKYPDQHSVSINLEAGQRYYIEALQKEADQKDNLSVAWQIPGGAPTVIEGSYLSPFTP
ncbi:hypothetical protein BH10CHL1_BH10CHL1_25110 [soil metagenome]